MFRRWMSVSVITKPLLKLLIPQYAVRPLLQEGGALIKELRTKTSGNIRLSAHRHSLYPGTFERVLALSGELNEITELNNYFMDIVQDSSRDELRGNTVRVVLTNSAARSLISHGNLKIQEIQIESLPKNSSIVTCALATSKVPGEHLLNISGTKEQRIEACQQVIEKICVDPVYMKSSDVNYGMTTNDGINLKTKVEVTMEIPNFLVKHIIGKGGKNVIKLIEESGAIISLSNRDEYVPGTTKRTVKIVGEMDQAYNAYNLIKKNVQQLQNPLVDT